MKKKYALITIIVSFLAIFSQACGTDNGNNIDNNTNENVEVSAVKKTGMPIVEESITLDFFTGQAPASPDNWSELMLWEHYADMTNINVDFNLVPHASLQEKRNLALASGTLPDVFYGAGLSNLDLLKYGEQGTLIPLNDLIEEYAPSFSALIEKYPEVKQALTFPDGNIYSMPNVRAPEFLSMRVGARPWINQVWLEELDMDMPATTDEYYDYLTAVKTTDLNGNGKNDEIPYGGNSINPLVGWIKGSFGLGNNGPHHIDLPPGEDKVRFIPESEDYKEMLVYLNKLFEEGLIEQNIFSIEHEQYLSNAAGGLYGSTVFYDPEVVFGGEVGDSFVGGLALEGPNGDQIYGDVTHPVFTMGHFAITNKNQHPEATMRWVDYFYSDEGAELFYMGIEDETYQKNEDGTLEYTDKIKNSSEGLTLEQELSKYLTWVGNASPSIVNEKVFFGSESTEASIQAAEKLEPYVIEEPWPLFTFTEDENKLLQSKGNDIEKYVNEMRDKFIAGEESLSKWDNYIETLQSMGLEEFMEVQQAAYDRYEQNKD